MWLNSSLVLKATLMWRIQHRAMPNLRTNLHLAMRHKNSKRGEKRGGAASLWGYANPFQAVRSQKLIGVERSVGSSKGWTTPPCSRVFLWGMLEEWGFLVSLWMSHYRNDTLDSGEQEKVGGKKECFSLIPAVAIPDSVNCRAVICQTKSPWITDDFNEDLCESSRAVCQDIILTLMIAISNKCSLSFL